ncbi:MAG: hypothetical protein KIT72_03210 [Polyangiaceae bacterium]|nr:hypothetical protein [Polyangiaceae bacterium]MCW5789409.1 hypothetical protein [Polyangiaceae bacterium]
MLADKRLIGAAGVVLGLLATGCDWGCNDDYVYPAYRIRVSDARTGAAICDAEVSVNGRSASLYERGCEYVRQITDDGMSEITVVRAGYESLTREVSTSYEKDDCGKALPKRVSIKLHPL